MKHQAIFPVILNLFQHPFRVPAQVAQVEKWTLKQVQGDEYCGGEF